MKNKPRTKNYLQISSGRALTSDSVFLVVISGFLLFLSFPKYGSGWLAWIAFVPLFFALRKAASITQAFLLGFYHRNCQLYRNNYWIASVVTNYGYLPLYLGIIFDVASGLLSKCLRSFVCRGIVYFRGKVALYLVVPVLWVCLEYCKSYLLTGFPWENLGYSQYLNLYLIQFADIAGVLVVFFNCCS